MSTSDQNQSQTHGGEQGRATGTAAAPQAEAGAERGARHGRRRRGRQEQRPSQQRRAESALHMDELRELTELFSSHGLTDFQFENADLRIRLSRNPAPVAASAASRWSVQKREGWGAGGRSSLKTNVFSGPRTPALCPLPLREFPKKPCPPPAGRPRAGPSGGEGRGPPSRPPCFPQPTATRC